VGGGCCTGFNIVSGGMGERGNGENEVQLSLYFVVVTHPLGLSLPGSPLVILTPPFLLRETRSRPHPFGKGRGSCDYLLASEGPGVVLDEPTSLKLGEGLATGSFGVVGGEMRWRGQMWW